RSGESPVGSRWYCRHQHALSRYFRLSTRVVFYRCIDGTAKGRGLSPPAPVASPCSWRRNWCLLDFDGRACGLEVLLHLLGVFLRSAFLHGAAGLGEVLGFLQAQAGDGADGLDDLHLLVAGGLQDDRELGLLLGGGTGGGGRTGGHHGGSGGDAEL